MPLDLPFPLLPLPLLFSPPLAPGDLKLYLGREALLMVALILVVLAACITDTGDGTLVVILHLGLAAGVGLLFLPLQDDTVPITVWGMD